MAQVEIESLTTCTDSSLARVRKSLLLSGYQVASQDDASLTTEDKLAQGYARDRWWRRLTVRTLADGRLRFFVRMREERTSEPPIEAVTGPAMRQRPMVTTPWHAGEEVREFDLDFYEEERADYEELQRTVCGF